MARPIDAHAAAPAWRPVGGPSLVVASLVVASLVVASLVVASLVVGTGRYRPMGGWDIAHRPAALIAPDAEVTRR